MSGENQNSKTSNLKEIRDLTKDAIDALQKDVISLQDNQQMLMQYEKLRFRLKQSESEQQQQPLPEDLSLIDKNISDLKETVDRLKNSLEYRFNHLRSLQIELDAILEKYEPKDKDATTNTNDPTPPHGH